MTATRAVVLAAGRGTRMQRAGPERLSAEQAVAADRGLKTMMPVGRPFLDYVLSSLADAGLAEVCLVIGPDHDLIRRRYTVDVVPERLSVRFAVQEAPRGTADAVLAAETAVAGKPFVLVNGDNLYPVDALRLLAAGPGPGLVGYRRAGLLAGGDFEAERIARFALAWAGAEGMLERIVEKPKGSLAHDPEAFVSMNSWCFDAGIFDACRAVAPGPRGELELQDAVRIELDRGVRYRIVPWDGPVLDLSSRSDVARVTARLAQTAVRL